MKRAVGIFLVALLVVMFVEMLGARQAWAISSIDGWSKTYGGNGEDVALDVVQTSDGGYALVGVTNSSGAGNYDFWLVKADASGTMQWNQTYGGTNNDEASAIVQTSDGGYALAGPTYSIGAGKADFWLVKTDGNGLVPEFQSTPLLAVLVTITSLTVILTKRKSREGPKRAFHNALLI